MAKYVVTKKVKGEITFKTFNFSARTGRIIKISDAQLNNKDIKIWLNKGYLELCEKEEQKSQKDIFNTDSNVNKNNKLTLESKEKASENEMKSFDLENKKTLNKQESENTAFKQSNIERNNFEFLETKEDEKVQKGNIDFDQKEKKVKKGRKKSALSKKLDKVAKEMSQESSKKEENNPIIDEVENNDVEFVYESDKKSEIEFIDLDK
jgi:hypothetical protein